MGRIDAAAPKDLPYNPFHHAQLFRDRLQSDISRAMPSAHYLEADFDLYVFPTKYCPVGCGHCYFQSPTVPRTVKKENDPYVFQGESLARLIDFQDWIAPESLTITGGGDPFMNISNVLKLIEGTQSSEVVIHTSAFWSSNPEVVRKYLNQIRNAKDTHEAPPEVTLRLSVDEFHNKVPLKNLANVIAIMIEEFPDLKVSLHSLVGDTTLNELTKYLNDELAIEAQLEVVSDSEFLKFDRHQIKVSRSVRFHSTDNPNMANQEDINAAIAAFDRGRTQTPAKPDGEKFCLCVYEDGTVELWNTGVTDRLPNVRSDDPLEILTEIFTDPITHAAIEKGAAYIDDLVNEIEPDAVRYAKAVGSATLYNMRLLKNPKTRLYVTVRVIQDFIEEGYFSDGWREELGEINEKLIDMTLLELQKLYFSF